MQHFKQAITCGPSFFINMSCADLRASANPSLVFFAASSLWSSKKDAEGCTVVMGSPRGLVGGEYCGLVVPLWRFASGVEAPVSFPVRLAYESMGSCVAKTCVMKATYKDVYIANFHPK